MDCHERISKLWPARILLCVFLVAVVIAVLPLSVELIFGWDLGELLGISSSASSNFLSWITMNLSDGIVNKNFFFSDKRSKKCSLNLNDFSGRIPISKIALSKEDLEKKYSYLLPGGHHMPTGCEATDKMAVIVPFRDRDTHLRILLDHMHRFLKHQKIDYSIIVVEQVPHQTLNRAKLLNVGFMEAMLIYPWDCLLFHDVDVLPEDDRILHTCPTKNPRHMAVAMNKFGYKLPYPTMFGTSTALTVEQFRLINGFSNRYWGWGGEDDDLYNRVTEAGYDIDRYPEEIARYTMLHHGREPKSNPVNPCRFTLLQLTKRDWKTDGLNNLNYTLIKKTNGKLYTHLLVDVLEKIERPIIESGFCKKKQ